ncbi:MAG TPA: folylpolyglutamate synthase/dihydrofolate synthase family protein [Limnochordales bacterium]|nr:folylpolyglutamate synthase/dihydrofolate synthase family protein [Limnochordales bacterium]
MSSPSTASGGAAPGLAYLRQLRRFGEKPGLARIRFLLERLGNPHTAYRCVHVAGTNGKGSTAAMIAAVLQAAGYRVGLFTSPHLVRYNERIVVDGGPIPDADLGALLAELREHGAAAAQDPAVGQPTEFEVATAAALAYFARRAVDVAVVEVGLGGRLDSTNVVHPLVSVLTPIGLDHTGVLGDSLAEVAAEKAGIIRPGVPVVCGPQSQPARRVILLRAEELGAPVFLAGRDFTWHVESMDARGTRFTVGWGDGWLENLQVPLLGRHQATNGAVAAAVARVLAEEGWPVPDQALRQGLSRVRWPGRMELVPGRPAVLYDGAHNAEGAQVLADGLRTLFPGQRPVFVLGILAEKPIDAMLQVLLPLGRAAVFTAPRDGRSAPADPGELARRAQGLVETAVVEPDPLAALARARELAGPDGLVCVAGSLYLVGELQGRLAGNPGG